jgi:beta-glucanase (GH16 family)
MRRLSIRSHLGLAALALSLGGACTPPAEPVYDDPNGPVVWQPGSWSLVWQDEFDGPAGSPPDPTRWTHEIGGWGWGNRELQSYTDSTNNSALDGAGNLILTARQEMLENNAYTSARLRTKGLFAHTYGRFEARMRLANGRGLWPAFWIMGDDLDEVGWPNAGEMDIVEQRGGDVLTVSGSLHGPAATWSADVPVTRAVSVPGGVDASFHVYAVEWDPSSIVFLVDDAPYFQITPSRRPYWARWVFDHPFFMILNLAVGGYFPGNPDATTMFPTTIAVDYVRVSERQGDGGTGRARRAPVPLVDQVDAGAD